MLLKDILYFKSDSRLVKIITREKIRRFYGKLNDIEQRLIDDDEKFIRIHPSYLVNFRNVEEIYSCSVNLSNNRNLIINEDRRSAPGYISIFQVKWKLMRLLYML